MPNKIRKKQRIIQTTPQQNKVVAGVVSLFPTIHVNELRKTYSSSPYFLAKTLQRKKEIPYICK